MQKLPLIFGGRIQAARTVRADGGGAPTGRAWGGWGIDGSRGGREYIYLYVRVYTNRYPLSNIEMTHKGFTPPSAGAAADRTGGGGWVSGA